METFAMVMVALAIFALIGMAFTLVTEFPLAGLITGAFIMLGYLAYRQLRTPLNKEDNKQ